MNTVALLLTVVATVVAVALAVWRTSRAFVTVDSENDANKQLNQALNRAAANARAERTAAFEKSARLVRTGDDGARLLSAATGESPALPDSPAPPAPGPGSGGVR